MCERDNALDGGSDDDVEVCVYARERERERDNVLDAGSDDVGGVCVSVCVCVRERYIYI